MQTRIVWNGQGGELDSTTVEDDGDRSVTDALIELVRGHIVSPGDTFVIEAVTD
jgi:hypothetical protein